MEKLQLLIAENGDVVGHVQSLLEAVYGTTEFARKSRRGSMMADLQDPVLLEQKKQAETELQELQVIITKDDNARMNEVVGQAIFTAGRNAQNPRCRQRMFNIMLAMIREGTVQDEGIFVLLRRVVVSGLTDVWSPIRKDAARGFRAEAFSLKQLELIFADLQNICSSGNPVNASPRKPQHATTWQQVEGAVAGISALIKAFQPLDAAPPIDVKTPVITGRYTRAPSHSRQDSMSAPVSLTFGSIRLERFPKFMTNELVATLYDMLAHQQPSVRASATMAFQLLMERRSTIQVTRAFHRTMAKLKAGIPPAFRQPRAVAPGSPDVMHGNLMLRSREGAGDITDGDDSFTLSTPLKVSTRHPSTPTGPFVTTPSRVDAHGNTWMRPQESAGLLGVCSLFVVRSLLPASVLLQNWSELFTTICSFLSHPASTVRQAASNLMQDLAGLPLEDPMLAMFGGGEQKKTSLSQNSTRPVDPCLSVVVLQSLVASWPDGGLSKTRLGADARLWTGKQQSTTDQDAAVLCCLPPRLDRVSNNDEKHSRDEDNELHVFIPTPNKKLTAPMSWQTQEGFLFVYELILVRLWKDHITTQEQKSRGPEAAEKRECGHVLNGTSLSVLDRLRLCDKKHDALVHTLSMPNNLRGPSTARLARDMIEEWDDELDLSAVEAEQVNIDCESCLLGQHLARLKASPLHVLLGRMLLHTTLCCHEKEWELRRMADQVMPKLVTLLCFYDVSLLEALWKSEPEDIDVHGWLCCLSFKYALICLKKHSTNKALRAALTSSLEIVLPTLYAVAAKSQSTKFVSVFCEVLVLSLHLLDTPIRNKTLYLSMLTRHLFAVHHYARSTTHKSIRTQGLRVEDWLLTRTYHMLSGTLPHFPVNLLVSLLPLLLTYMGKDSELVSTSLGCVTAVWECLYADQYRENAAVDVSQDDSDENLCSLYQKSIALLRSTLFGTNSHDDLIAQAQSETLAALAPVLLESKSVKSVLSITWLIVQTAPDMAAEAFRLLAQFVRATHADLVQNFVFKMSQKSIFRSGSTLSLPQVNNVSDSKASSPKKVINEWDAWDDSDEEEEEEEVMGLAKQFLLSCRGGFVGAPAFMTFSAVGPATKCDVDRDVLPKLSENDVKALAWLAEYQC